MFSQDLPQFGLISMNVFKEFISLKFFFGRIVGFKTQGLLMTLLLVSFSGCTNVDIEKAFNGDLRPGQANKVIGEYCQSCHIHKDFDPPLHVSKVRNLYNRPAFKKGSTSSSHSFFQANFSNEK